MMKKTPTFLPIEYKTTEERYQDIEKRNKKIEEELFSIMNAWANFKSELYKIEKSLSKKKSFKSHNRYFHSKKDKMLEQKAKLDKLKQNFGKDEDDE